MEFRNGLSHWSGGDEAAIREAGRVEAAYTLTYYERAVSGAVARLARSADNLNHSDMQGFKEDASAAVAGLLDDLSFLGIDLRSTSSGGKRN